MVNTQDEMAGNSVSELNWCGFDQLRLSDDVNAVDVTIGSLDKWDKAHLRRLRQSADLPGLVPVIDSDFASNGKPFAVTPVVDSPTLADRIPPSGSEWEDCAAITEAAARATHEAHLRGLFHGSLSPDQINVIDDDVAVQGIGLGLGGSPSTDYAHWVAPEIVDGNDATERSDVFSLGKILEASLGTSLEDVPRSVRRLIMWSSSDTPEARPPSALEFASILAEALGEDRKIYSPAFIPTAEANDLASTASEAVASFVPSESSSESSGMGAGAAAAGIGAAAVGAAAVGSILDNDDAGDDAADVVEEAAEAVDPDSEIDPDVLSDAVSTGELPNDAAEMATSTADLTEEEVTDAGDSSATAAFDSRQYGEDIHEVDDDFDAPAAARTVDLDQAFEPERKGNKAGILVGAVLAAGLGLIAYNLLSSDDSNDVASDGGAIVDEAEDADDADLEEDVASPATSDETESATETEEQVTTTTVATSTTTEASTTTTEAAPEVVEAAPASTVEGPISSDEAGVQVLHGIPGAEVDVYVNGEALAPGFTLGTIAGPADLAAGNYDIDLYAASDVAPASASDRSDDPLISQTMTVGDDPTTLVAHLDGEGNPVISAFVEDFGELEPATARLELRHLAAAPAVTATIDGEPVGSLLEPGNSATLELAAGEHTIETATADGTPVKSATIDLADGELASVSIIGVASDNSIDAVIQRYTGLASAPAAVPTGNSDLLGAGEDPTGLYILGALTSLMAMAGGLVMMRRNRRVL